MNVQKSLLSSALLSATLVAPAIANETPMEEIVVTADFRQTDVQSIPEAVSVLGSARIEERSAEHLESLLALAPNVNFSSGASRGRFFQIRGIGERSQFVDPVNPSVGLRIDGIDMTGLGGAASLFDVQQVEVLRGPQGTRFGANALAGMINIESNAPTDHTEGYVATKLAQYNTQAQGGVISGALSDNARGRIAVQRSVSDGYMENVHLDRKDTNNLDETVARVRLDFEPNADDSLSLTLLHIKTDNGYDAFSLDNTRDTYSNKPGSDKQDTTAASLQWEARVNSALTLQLLASGSQSNTDYGYDEDWAFGEYIWMDDSVTYTPDPCDTSKGPCLAAADGYSSTDQYQRNLNRSELDVRFLSGDDGLLFGNTSWVAGVYVMQRDESLKRFYTWNAKDFGSSLTSRSQALYGELTTEASEQLRVITGLRHELWRTDYDDNNDIDSRHTERLWGGKLTLEYLVNDQHLAYGSAARGYKAGGVNTDPDISEANRTFDTEFNNAFEAGLKSSLLDDQLNTRLAVFYIKRKDQQVKSSYAIQAQDNSITFQDYLANAAEGQNYGVELESDWQLTEQLNWQLSYGYLITEFLDYDYRTEKGEFSKNGRAQAHAPQYSLATGVSYDFDNGLAISVQSEAKDEFYFSDSHDEQSRAYVLWHARLSYDAERWQGAIFGRNLTDVDQEVRGFHFGNDPRDGYSNKRWVQYGEPRLIGVEGKFFF